MKVYTLEEVSEILHLTKRTLYRHIETGALKAVKVGKYWMVSEEKLQELINNGTAKASKEGIISKLNQLSNEDLAELQKMVDGMISTKGDK